MVFTSTMFLLGNILFAIFVYPAVSKIGLRWSITIAMGIASFGTFLRLLVDSHFGYLVMGQFLLGVAANFIINTNMQFCYNWFSPQSRPIYLSLVAIMNIFGGGLGNSLPLIFVNDEESDAFIISNRLYSYNISMFILMVSLSGLTLLLFRDKPPRGYGYQKQYTESEEILGGSNNFFHESYLYLKYALSFNLFKTYLIIYVLCNSCLVFLGSVINILIGYFGYKSVS